MRPRPQKSLLILATSLALCLPALGFSSLAQAAPSPSPAQDLFDQALFYLTFNYHGYSSVNFEALEVKYQARLEAACAGQTACAYATAAPILSAMSEELRDGHTSYWSASEYREFADPGSAPDGESDDRLPPLGLGALLLPIKGSPDVRVQEVLEGSPAGLAGVRRGDRITAFNGRNLPTSSLDALYAALGSALAQSPLMRLTILRNETETLEARVKVRAFGYDGLPWLEWYGEVARVIVPDFDTYGEVGPHLHTLVGQARARGARAIIVDLRDDGGGAATECISGVAPFVGAVRHLSQSRREKSEFGYREGVVYSRDANGRESPVYGVERATTWDGPLAVLVNARSASCAEVFAADVQFAKRGPIIGEATFGLGNTSSIFFGLIDGGALQLTIARTFRADGSAYPDRVKPDVIVSDDRTAFEQRGRDLMLERALEIVKGLQ
jgi:carboxyl-terminal processing protease